jgi:2-keto-3-deoxy-6-phosphogluconate aldolase
LAVAEVPEEALAAVKQLKALIEPGAGGVDAPELIRLVDLAASPIKDVAAREKLAEMLIGALTVLRFGSLLGGDIEAARQQAERVLATIAAGQARAASP